MEVTRSALAEVGSAALKFLRRARESAVRSKRGKAGLRLVHQTTVPDRNTRRWSSPGASPLRLAAAGLVIGLIGLVPRQASAASLLVDTTRDAIDVTPGDGICQTSATIPECTLRAAVIEANALPGRDLISFALIGVYKLELLGPGEDFALTGDLDLTDDLILRGNGPRQTVIDGGAVGDRVLHIHPAGSSVDVIIDGLTIQGGSTPDRGGGILVEENSRLALANGVVTRNSADRGAGVSVVQPASARLLLGTLVSRNTAATVAGGIHGSGALELTDVSIEDNTAGDGAGGAWIGGIALLERVAVSGNVGQTRLTGPTLADPVRGQEYAGGLRVAAEGRLTLRNSTISGNSGRGLSNSGSATLTNVTVTNNSSGLYNCGAECLILFARLTLENSIVAGNNTEFSGHIFDRNCTSAITSLGHNLDSGTTCGLGGPGDLAGVDPQLEPLAKNGGLTRTHALPPSSAAVDAASSGSCVPYDQRGVRRQGQGSACDIGAYEYQTQSFLVNSTDDRLDAVPGDGLCDTGFPSACTLRAAIIEANALPGPDVVRFAVDGEFRPSIPGWDEDGSTTGDLDVTGDLQIVGNGIAKTMIVAEPSAFRDRLFDIDPGDRGIVVSLSGLQLKGGHADSAGSGIRNGKLAALILTDMAVVECKIDQGIVFYGAGIANFGELTLRRAEVKENALVGSVGSVLHGGGLWNGGVATLVDSSVAANRSSTDGGGIATTPGSATTILRGRIEGNQAGRWGGGIYNDGMLTLTDTNVSDNGAGVKGGGIYASVEARTLLASASLVRNQAGLEGSAIMNNKGALSMTNVTLTGNRDAVAVTTSGTTTIRFSTVAANAGGGLQVGSGITTLEAIIIAGSGSQPNCGGTITSLGRNLDSGASCPFTAPGDQSNANPLLGPRALNGNTWTHALLAGSPAIDRAGSNGCPATDQRGVARPRGPACDIGAYEAP
ncbi:MAG: right-handed parallel beta-helix repeat-containing protein [Geminicoccaceae bacterium]